MDAHKHTNALSCPGWWNRWAEPQGLVVSKAHIHTPHSSTPPTPSYTHQGPPFLSSSTLFKALPLVRHLSSHSIMLLLDEFSSTHFYPHSLPLLNFCVLFQLLHSEHMYESPLLKYTSNFSSLSLTFLLFSTLVALLPISLAQT